MAKTTRDIPKICTMCGATYMACLDESRVCSKRCSLRLWRSMLPNPPVKKGSQEHREKQRQISLANGSIPPSKKGWKPSEQTRLKQSLAAKGKSKPWFIGRKLTEEHKKKIGEGAIRSESWRVLFRPEIRAKAIELSKLNRPVKEKHWNWKGGVPRLVPERNSLPWKKWRTQIFERDNYICQRCEVRGGLLVPHHIIPRKIRPDLIYDINNGSTLCSTCHPTVEKEFRLMNFKKKEGESLRH